jgi:two-component system response regulator YesN
MMIADDEPKIRNGLRKMLDYSQFGIEVVGEAEDGEITLREAAKKKPDILFLDICMPFLNGLELIGKLKEQVDCLIVIITGYDQFAYMQEAIKLQVFDYLLKPVSKADLTDTVKRVCSELDKRRSKDRYFKWVNDRIEENFDTMRDNFFQNLTRKGMDSEQITSGLRFFNIHFTEQIGIVVLKIIKHSQFSKEVGGLDPNMMLFGVKNMAEELLGSDCFFCFFDDAGNVVIIGNARGIERWSPFCSDLCAHLGEYVGGSAAFESGIVNSLTDVTAAYQELAQELKRKTAYRPITSSILQYIQSNYYDNSFSLERTADKFNITPPYLSKLLKSETGFTFIDVLTNTRIRKAITLMDTTSLKIYEISELVGYNNQYYFSRSFKKVTGVSPVQYREGKHP